MDLGTIVGVLGGTVIIVVTVLLTGIPTALFLSLSSLIMVVGGSFAAMLVGNPASRITKLFSFIMIAVRAHQWHEERIVSDLVAYAGRARREGLLSLEDYVEEVDDAFMAKGIQLVVDGTDPEIIQRILSRDLEKIEERHDEIIKVFDDWGKLAPSFGLIGTLIGLVAMLVNLGDRGAIGRGLAIALLTTMYGTIFANLFLIPIRTKLEYRSRREVLVREIIIEGVLSIQSGDNPRILLEKLIAYLPPAQRESVYGEIENR